MTQEGRRNHLTEWAHGLIAPHLASGAAAIDATAGNGHDAAFLARSVGPAGKVFAFDLQAEAITRSRLLLESENLAAQVHLVRACHSRIQEFVPREYRGRIAAVMFNLGYLPSGDHSLVTRSSTTLLALEQSGELLAPGGILSVLAYPAHPGGREEAEAVADWMKMKKKAGDGIERHVSRSFAGPVLWLLRPEGGRDGEP